MWVDTMFQITHTRQDQHDIFPVRQQITVQYHD